MEMNEEIKKLVIARLRTMPPNIKISVGNFGSFKRDELIEEIEKESEIGKLIIEVDLNYLRSWKMKV